MSSDRLQFLRDLTALLVAPTLLGENVDITIDVGDADGQGLRGIVPITVTVHPPGGLRHVQILIDETVVSDDISAPYDHAWDTTRYANGTHIVGAIAIYKMRRSTAQLAVTVNNSALVIYPSPTLFPSEVAA